MKDRLLKLRDRAQSLGFSKAQLLLDKKDGSYNLVLGLGYSRDPNWPKLEEEVQTIPGVGDAWHVCGALYGSELQVVTH